jgi:adenylylsulfate kinase
MAEKKLEKPFVLWMTGLSGAGKTTLGLMVYDYLSGKGIAVERLDGDVIRDIFPSTGFSREERDGHVKRIGFVASLLEKHGVCSVVSFISPYRDTRKTVRDMCSNFIEVYIDTTIEECEKRDVKGLYKKVREGKITNFTGIDDPYEIPDNPEIRINTSNHGPEESFNEIKKYLDSFIK